jgi:D-alanyl-lipoteichoic acid acyltransferase DltB (MBOAT superfamily)
MDTGSYQFALFGLGAALLSNCSRTRGWRVTVLSLASVVFLLLLAHGPATLAPMFAFLLLGYAGLRLRRREGRGGIAWTVGFTVLVYMLLKQYSFLPAALFLRSPYFSLGLSYIFFRVLHLQIEAGEKEMRKPIGLGAYLLYMLNFTTLVSGPIQRYQDFARDQFARSRWRWGRGWWVRNWSAWSAASSR